MNDVTVEGQRLITAWLVSQDRERSASVAAADAHQTRLAAEKDLAAWLLPDDYVAGESFCVWHGGSLIKVNTVSGGSPTVEMRKGSSRMRSVPKDSK